MHKALAMQANTHTHSLTDVRILTRKKQTTRCSHVCSLSFSLSAALSRRRVATSTSQCQHTTQTDLALTFGCVQQRRSLMRAAQLAAERVRGQSKHNKNNKLWQIKTIRLLSLLLLLFLATCCLNKCAFRMRRERREQQQQHRFLSGEGERCVV